MKKPVSLTFLTCVTLSSFYHVTLTLNKMNLIFLTSAILTFWLGVTLTLRKTENLNWMIFLTSAILTFWYGHLPYVAVQSNLCLFGVISLKT